MPTTSAESASMDQVRELLMGNQVKDIGNRMHRQEEQFKRDIADLRDSVNNRVESLENFMKSESASFMNRLREEQNERSLAFKNAQKERADAMRVEQVERAEADKKERLEREETTGALGKEFAKELAALEESLERKIAALSSTFDSVERELRQLILSEHARLANKLDEKYQELLKTLTETALQIRYDVVARSALSGLFAEAAIKFSNQTKTDGAVDAALLDIIGEGNDEKTTPAKPGAKDGKSKTNES